MTRPALSDADRAARDLFVDWLHELELSVRVDDFGNIFGRRAGQDDGAAPVLVGSHLDTVPLGGRFDGILGIVAALEVVSTLHETQLRHVERSTSSTGLVRRAHASTYTLPFLGLVMVLMILKAWLWRSLCAFGNWLGHE